MFKALTFLPLLIAATTYRPTGVENSAFLIKTPERIQLLVPFVHQIENLTEESKKQINSSACGPSALTMALNFEGEKYKLNEVIEKLPETIYRKGDRFYDLPKGAEFFSKKSVQIENSPKNIYETLTNGKPVILNVQNYDGMTGHAVVVTGMIGFNGKSAKSLIVHDPYRAAYREFDYINNSTLKQPEGYILPIGILKPFYLSKL